MNTSACPRLAGDRAFVAVAAISTAALTFLRARSLDDITRWWIPAFELVVLARAILPVRPWNRLRTHLALALVFCLLGDLLINWTPWGNGCIAFFAVTHLNLLWIFVHLRRPRRRDLPRLLPWCLASAAVLAAIAGESPSMATFAALAAYALLLDLMVWRAVSLLARPRTDGAIPLAVGALLFFATDHLVILQIFRPAPVWVVATWLCYPPCLALLALAARCLEGRD